MLLRPEKRMPKPMRTEPVLSEFLNLRKMKKMTPMVSEIGASVDGLKMSSQLAEPFELMSISLMIWPVMVVPTLAPKMMPTDCLTLSTPAETRPAVMTIVAVDDCITAVTSKPSRKALIGLFVTVSSTFFNAPEELSFMVLLMSLIP